MSTTARIIKSRTPPEPAARVRPDTKTSATPAPKLTSAKPKPTDAPATPASTPAGDITANALPAIALTPNKDSAPATATFWSSSQPTPCALRGMLARRTAKTEDGTLKTLPPRGPAISRLRTDPPMRPRKSACSKGTALTPPSRATQTSSAWTSSPTITFPPKQRQPTARGITLSTTAPGSKFQAPTAKAACARPGTTTPTEPAPWTTTLTSAKPEPASAATTPTAPTPGEATHAPAATVTPPPPFQPKTPNAPRLTSA